MTEPTATDPETGIVEGGERRVPFEEAHPEVDSWRSPAKRVLGDRVIAERDLVEGAYDAIAGRVLFRRAGSVAWRNRHSRRLRTIVGVRRSRSIPYMRELTKPEADSPGESFQVHDVL
ncbi:MAG TPA: hypothetical protein VM925_27235, partial [Labilithrix sp.]|nr:hypothetical protein [Labilithrix sp.]